MNDTLTIVIGGLVALIGGVVSIVLLWMQNKQAIKMAILTQKQKETHDLINSRMTELLELAKKESRAEGKLEGKAEQKEETREENSK